MEETSIYTIVVTLVTALGSTAAWNFYTVSQHILGIKPDYDGLHLEPHLPSSINEIHLIRAFRGNTYKIHIRHNGIGVKVLTVNGIEWNGALPCEGPGRTYDVNLIY